ncbi:NYN domain-containing protein [Caldalkalibacillus salinus]|uniref:NYN domain-containing protein n=1 Tax=Caldalkalibacillus salinus TaxID=2803787 RepID=UPI0019236EF4|nr:NYN domain-containing protein [Caldalkalibacillus salinus]
MEDILIVDGYNIIGATKSMGILNDDDLGNARDWLIEKLAEYQGYKGIKVYIIFDAHMVPGIGSKLKQRSIDIIYTKENETADERIEKLVQEIKRVQRRITVATSDHTEQWVVFGQGALRQSARELVNELRNMEESIGQTLESKYQQKPKSHFPLSDELAELFDKWRREK